MISQAIEYVNSHWWAAGLLALVAGTLANAAAYDDGSYAAKCREWNERDQ